MTEPRDIVSVDKQPPAGYDLSDFDKFMIGQITLSGKQYTMATRSRLYSKFYDEFNPKFQKLRYADLATVVNAEIAKFRANGPYNSLHSSQKVYFQLSEKVEALFKFWQKQWKAYPFGDPRFTLSIALSDGAVTVIEDTGLCDIREGKSGLDAITDYPTAWPEFINFLQS